MNELRRHYFLDQWVIVSSDRSKRPSQLEIEERHVRQAHCPFCPDNLKSPVLARVGEPWRIAVIPNKFPALDSGVGMWERDDFLKRRAGFGRHEVIIDHPGHERLEDFSEEHLADLLRVFAERTRTHMSDDRIRYVSIFRNSGAAAGASIAHPHSQLIALPVVPGAVAEERGKLDEFFHLFGECPFSAIHRHEKEEGERLLLEGRHCFALAPFASVTPGETWLVPQRHVRTLFELSDAEVEALARMLRRTMVTLMDIFPRVPYNLMVHQAPRGRDFHLHLEIRPRLGRLAGFELANDMFINTFPPEAYANEFRRRVVG